MTRLAPAPAWSRRKAVARRFFRSLLKTIGGFIAVGFIYGCASTDKVDVAAKPTTPLIRQDLMRLSRREFNDCVQSFYQDDWERLALHAEQFNILCGRWKDQKVRPEDASLLADQSTALTAAAAQLKTKVDARDVLGVTTELRKISGCLAALDKIPLPADPPPATANPDKAPSNSEPAPPESKK